MLDVSLRDVSWSYGKRPALHDVSASFRRGSFTAIAGVAGSGASTLLQLVAGDIQPKSGEVLIGARVVNGWKRAKRPLLYVTGTIDAPPRWSVAHALIAAARKRSLDREDRQHELEFLVAKWELEPLMDRTLRDLSSGERLRVHLASIELLRPALLVADRLFEHATAAEIAQLTDRFHRAMRVTGTTVIFAPDSLEALSVADEVVVLDGGRVVQQGTFREVYDRPVSEVAARATGDVSVVPLEIRRGTVESVMGSWQSDAFEGSGVAVCRPEHFAIASPGEESDVILAIEAARFAGGRWLVTGNLSGAVPLTISVDPSEPIGRGRLLPLRYDPRRFTLLPREIAMPHGAAVPTDVLPSRASSR